MVLPGHPRSSSAPGAPPGPWEWRLRPIWPPGHSQCPACPAKLVQEEVKPRQEVLSREASGRPSLPLVCPLIPPSPGCKDPPTHTNLWSQGKLPTPSLKLPTPSLSPLCSHPPLSLPVAPTPAPSNVPTRSARIYPVAPPPTPPPAPPSLPQMPTPNHPVCKAGPWPLALRS